MPRHHSWTTADDRKDIAGVWILGIVAACVTLINFSGVHKFLALCTQYIGILSTNFLRFVRKLGATLYTIFWHIFHKLGVRFSIYFCPRVHKLCVFRPHISVSGCNISGHDLGSSFHFDRVLDTFVTSETFSFLVFRFWFFWFFSFGLWFFSGTL